MNYDEIINELKAKLGDDRAENVRILKEAGEKFANDGNREGLEAVGELLIANMSGDKRQEIERLIQIDGMRLDVMHDKINEYIEKGEILNALPMAERLYKKITEDYSDTDTEKFVSLRNPFEDNLCQLLFPTDKTLKRTPFDFAAYLTTYAYLLVETGANIDAIPVLERAIEINPVDVGPKFELAEIYKILRNRRMVLETSRETLRVAASPMAVARCYANIAYALVDAQEYEDAAVFYVASIMFNNDPAIPLEMQHLTGFLGHPIQRPSREKIIETLKKYDLEFGPNQQVIQVASELAMHYINEDDTQNALYALKMVYCLTLDEGIKNLILRLDPDSQLVKAMDDTVAAENRSNISVTENNSEE